MARKNIPQIDALVQRTFAQKMWDNGFHPYKDHTEWLRLVDGNILQTVLFYEYLTIDLRVEYYAQPLSEYLWCNYRQPNIRGYIAGYFCDMMGRYKLGDPEMCRIAGPYGGTRVWDEIPGPLLADGMCAGYSERGANSGGHSEGGSRRA